MKRFLSILLAAVLLLANFAFAETTGFDYTVLSELDGYKYDKFEKEWKYYGTYHIKYSDATVVIGIQAYGYTSIVEGIDIYAYIRDKDNKESIEAVSQLKIVADDHLITCNMLIGDDASLTVVGPNSKDVLRLISEAKELSFKLTFKTDAFKIGSITLEPSAEDVAELVTAAKNMYEYNLVDYISDWEYLEWIADDYPITIE